MTDSALTYLHLLTPFVLSLPVLTLLRPPPKPPTELPGIRPVTIRTVTPRRAFILTLLSLLAVTAFADTAILVADLLTANGRDHSGHLEGLGLASGLVYGVGGFLVWALAAIICEWRATWGEKGMVVLSMLGLACEIPNLVLLVLRELHTYGSGKLFTILPQPPSALRLLIEPVLLVMVLSPIIRYRPADETTGLLTDQNGGPSAVSGREAYGTFPNDEENGYVKAGPATSTANPTGVNTPAQKKPSITIPKNLGEVRKEDKPLPLKEIWARLKKLSPYLWPSTSRKLQLFVTVVMGMIAAERVIKPLVPVFLGRIVRALASNQNGEKGSSPWPPFITWTLLRLSITNGGILSFTRERLWIGVSQYTDREMQILCFNHLLNLSLAYHTKRNTGEVLKIIDRGSAINNLFETMLFTAIPTVFDIIIGFGVFFYLYGGLLAFITFLIMGLYVAFAVTMTQQRLAVRRLLMDKDVKQRGIVSDVLTNWESVKYFTAEAREVVRFREAIASYQETEAKLTRSWQLLFLIQNALLASGLMAGSLIIAYRSLHGKADAAEFVVFIQYFQQLSGPLDRLGFLYRQLNQNTTDAEKMFTLLNQATEVNDKPGARDLVISDGIIEFDNVTFSYDDRVDALKGVSFKIDKGRSMALVGESGSGKSTILRLLYRFYDITSGHIYIDGQDISEVTQVSLRQAIGIVPQDSVLWNDTIGANIAYGKQGASDEEIIAAAEAGRLHDRILSFSDGYSTVVGERGIRLSGGEKQRVSLARMFLKSPAILVLDEATSALDTETEREIQRALSDLAKGRSSLSIAHRLSTIINSDQIVVMKDGQVIENGAYKELLDLNGSFATMWKKQIFTEVEMVAQAEAVDSGDVIKTLVIEDDSSGSFGNDGGGGESALQEQEMEKKADEKIEAKEQPDSTDEAPVYKVDEAGPTPSTHLEFVSTHDDAVEAEPTQDAMAKSGDHPATEANAGEKEEDSHAEPSTSECPSIPSQTSPTVPEPSLTVSNPAPPIEFFVPSGETSVPASSKATSTEPAIATPSNQKAAVPFPSMPRRKTSQSTQSNLSELGSGASTDDVTELTPSDGKDKDKRRKRLSSIKGLVRRISERPGSSGKSPIRELDETTAMLPNRTSTSDTPGGEASDKNKKKQSQKKHRAR